MDDPRINLQPPSINGNVSGPNELCATDNVNVKSLNRESYYHAAHEEKNPIFSDFHLTKINSHLVQKDLGPELEPRT